MQNNNTSASTSTRTPATVRELYQQGNEAREQIEELVTAIRSLLQGGDAVLRERMKAQPYATIAAAAGVGYVLGGGLSPSMVRLLILAGGRMAFQGFVQRLADGDATAR